MQLQFVPCKTLLMPIYAIIHIHVIPEYFINAIFSFISITSLMTLLLLMECTSYCQILNMAVYQAKLWALQNALSSRNDHSDQQCTPHHWNHQDRPEKREFSNNNPFRHSSCSCSPHHPTLSKHVP